MQAAVKKYLHFVLFSDLINWSVQYMLDTKFSYAEKHKLVEINNFLKRNKTAIDIEDDEEYKRVTIKINNGGVFLRDIERGINIGTKKQFIVSKGQFLLSKIDARNGAFGVVSKEVNGAIITGNFWTFDVDYSKINPHFLSLITTTPEFIKFSENASNGTTNRHYLQEELFLAQKIPLPSLEEQKQIVENYNASIRQAEALERQANDLEKEIENYLFEVLGIEREEKKNEKNGKLHFTPFSELVIWGFRQQSEEERLKSSKYSIISIEQNPKLAISVFRGKSPKYEENSDAIILNQKCNRWNVIDLAYTKTVNSQWLFSLNKNDFTKKGDILVNSTGEGTIGRATVIRKEHEGLMYDSHILLLRLNEKNVNPEYFTSLFNSSYGQQQVDNIKSAQSTKQTELGVGNLQKIKFPLPPIDIQEEIANHIQMIRTKIKTLWQNAEENRKRAITEFEQEIFE